jgi:transcriptional regulator with XRE-family HTH domain
MGEILDSVEIGRRIRSMRKQKRLSQERLAELIEVSTQQVHKYEIGVNLMNTNKLQAIANALAVPVASFFDDMPIETLPFSEQERILIESFRKISDRRIQECILEFAQFAKWR